MPDPTATVYVVDGQLDYHTDPGCPALHEARLAPVAAGTVHIADHTDVKITRRPACTQCAAEESPR